MTVQPPPVMERLRTIPQLAQELGVHRVTLFRQLMRLHVKDQEQGRGAWLTETPTRRRLRVNLSLLRREHPGLFVHRYVTRDEHEDIVRRVERLEQQVREGYQRSNAVAASVRTLRCDLEAVTARCST